MGNPPLLISLAALVFLAGYAASLWIGSQVVPDNALEVGLIFWTLKAVYVFLSGRLALRAFKKASGDIALLNGIFFLLSLWTLFIASQFLPWLAVGFFAATGAVFLARSKVPSYWAILPALISASFPYLA